MGLSDIASRLVKRFGEDGVFERKGAADRSVTPPVLGAPTQHPVTVALVSYEIDERSAGDVEVRHVRALASVDGLDIEPRLGDHLLVAGERYAVLNVTRITRRGAALFYDLRVVRS